MQFHMMTLLDVLGKIAWIKKDFLSKGKISVILIRCARIEYLSQAKNSDVRFRCARNMYTVRVTCKLLGLLTYGIHLNFVFTLSDLCLLNRIMDINSTTIHSYLNV